MCFKIESNVRYATKPIKVYKKLIYLTDKYISPYRSYEWKIGKLEKANFSFITARRTVAEKDKKYLGINQIYSPSYITFVNKSSALIKEVIDTKNIAEGLHSYANINAITFIFSGEVIAECEIPKHSWYYTNDEGECVSDQLIVKKILKRVKS